MKQLTSALSILVVSASLVLLFGCSGGALDRSTAEAKIKVALSRGGGVSTRITLPEPGGFLSDNCSKVDEFNAIDPYERSIVIILVQTGLLKISPGPRHGKLRPGSIFRDVVCEVKLDVADRLKEYVVPLTDHEKSAGGVFISKNAIRVSIGDPIVKVTGVAANGNNLTTAEAAISYEPNDVGKLIVKKASMNDNNLRQLVSHFSSGPKTKSFHFQKFDDGWRLLGDF